MPGWTFFHARVQFFRAQVLPCLDKDLRGYVSRWVVDLSPWPEGIP